MHRLANGHQIRKLTLLDLKAYFIYLSRATCLSFR